MQASTDAQSKPDPAPMREYISSMAGELADLARTIGDPRLALALDLAATFAEIRERRG